MVTIALLLTGDLQEAQMAQAYLRENYREAEYERIFVYCGEDAAAVELLDEDPSAVRRCSTRAGRRFCFRRRPMS